MRNENVDHKARERLEIHAMGINSAYYRLYVYFNELCDERPGEHYSWRLKSNYEENSRGTFLLTHHLPQSAGSAICHRLIAVCCAVTENQITLQIQGVCLQLLKDLI